MERFKIIYVIVLLLSLIMIAIPVSALGGTLSIKSTPSGANLYIDGSLKGITPMTINGITPGIHEVKLTSMGYEDFITSVTISLIKNTELATVLVEVTPTNVPVTPIGGAIIIVNPQTITLKVTQTPTLTRPQITLPTKKSGTPAFTQRTTNERTIPTKVTLKQPVKVTLKSQTPDISRFGELEIDSFPQGASVYLDGVLQGTTPMTMPEVSAGAHQLSLGMEGFSDYSTNVQVKSGTKTSLTQGKSVNLQPKGGTGKKR